MATTPKTVSVAVELDDESLERIRAQVADAVARGVRDGLGAAELPPGTFTKG